MAAASPLRWKMAATRGTRTSNAKRTTRPIVWWAGHNCRCDCKLGYRMRLTIKAKLAGAFGVIIVLSMITGVVAYSKLSSLDESQQHIVSQSARMTLAADVKSDIQEQQRAEIRMIQAFSDKETEDEYKSMMSLREKVRKQFGDPYSQTNESGKKLLDQAGVHSTISRISPAKWRC